MGSWLGQAMMDAMWRLTITHTISARSHGSKRDIGTTIDYMWCIRRKLYECWKVAHMMHPSSCRLYSTALVDKMSDREQKSWSRGVFVMYTTGKEHVRCMRERSHTRAMQCHTFFARRRFVDYKCVFVCLRFISLVFVCVSVGLSASFLHTVYIEMQSKNIETCYMLNFVISL